MIEPAPDARELPPPAPDAPSVPAVPAPPPPLTRARAVAEVVLCSSYPTQLLTATALSLAGIPALRPDGGLNARFVVLVSLGDALLVAALIVFFLRRSGDRLRDVCLGARPVWREASLGVALAPVMLVGVALLVAGLRTLIPTLHNVPDNPMGALMRDPATAALFAVVVVVAGGMREELQRGFQLHRLTGYVCGPGPALLLTSLAFGAGHTLQGYDVAIATGTLGLIWGLLYLSRQSIVAPMVSHGLFNLSQVLVAWSLGDAGLP